MGDADEEKIWLTRSRQGDPVAFAALVRTHQAMIHSLTYHLTGSLADCQDLAQETFIRAYQQLDAYQGSARFSSWLYRIAVNACLDWRRREARRTRVLTDWTEEAVNQPAAPGAGADGEAARQEVQAALMKLPAKQRAAIVLTVYAGHNHAAAAKILGCSETTVSWRIFAARRRLKKMLSRQGGQHD